MRFNVGIIKEGYLVDIVIINFNRLYFRFINDVISYFVYLVNGNDVEIMIVDGKILMFDGEVLIFDEEKVISEVEKVLEKFV